MKKILGALFVLVACLCLGGCAETKQDVTISNKGSIRATASVTIDLDAAIALAKKSGATNGQTVTKEDLWKSLSEDKGSGTFTRKTIDGKDCAVSDNQVETFSSIAAFYKKSGDVGKVDQRISESELRLGTSELLDGTSIPSSKSSSKEWGAAKEILQAMTITFSVTFSSPVTYVDSHGVIDSSNPNRAIWKGNFYDMFKWKYVSARCNNGITVRGVTQGTLTRKTVKLSYSGVSSATVNGKKLKTKTFSKSGTYNVVLRAANGNQQTVYFIVDKKKPTIKGVKNGKTYTRSKYLHFSDRNGIKSATLNGKKISTDGTYIYKKGKNVVKVTDYAGNVSKVKFRIK